VHFEDLGDVVVERADLLSAGVERDGLLGEGGLDPVDEGVEFVVALGDGFRGLNPNRRIKQLVTLGLGEGGRCE